MISNEVVNIARNLSADMNKEWKERIIGSLTDGFTHPEDMYLDGIIMAILDSQDDDMIKERKFIAYGAGKMASRRLPNIIKDVHFIEIWDRYSEVDQLNGIPVVRPHEVSSDSVFIVFLKEGDLKYQVISDLKSKGYKRIYPAVDFMWRLDQRKLYPDIKQYITNETRKIVDSLYNTYDIISDSRPQVLFGVIPKKYQDIKNIDKPDKEKIDEILNSIEEKIELTGRPDWRKTLNEFFTGEYSANATFFTNFELVLRELLRGGIKTRERPIRMEGDTPYDLFAVFELVYCMLQGVSSDGKKILETVNELLEMASLSIPLNAVCCKYMTENGKYREALAKARKLMHRYPNNLLANENFYQVALKCEKNGVFVGEDLPRYDLSERFCWCGISFAWCGGFNISKDEAEFGPCFRPLQCAARPEGSFWSGEDWIEFRKSVMDGSFRYCQKNQCANIVAGWLPRKLDCKDWKVKAVIDGDYSIIPDLDELHFSYDQHCNLQCPSCRLDTITNTKEKNVELDGYYKKYLKKYVKNAKHLCLQGCGEALLSPHSKKILQSLSREEYPKLEVELRTNMTVLNQRTWNSLGEGRHVIRHIAASIDGATKNTFEKLRYPANWDTVIDNLRFVQKLRINNEIDMFEFHVVVQKANIDELVDIVKLAIEMDADTVTFSRMINWRDMPQEEYDIKNPYWFDSDEHAHLMREMNKVEQIRDEIENGTCTLIKPGRKMYINIHFRPDPNESYDVIRTGRFKIR